MYICTCTFIYLHVYPQICTRTYYCVYVYICPYTSINMILYIRVHDFTGITQVRLDICIPLHVRVHILVRNLNDAVQTYFPELLYYIFFELQEFIAGVRINRHFVQLHVQVQKCITLYLVSQIVCICADVHEYTYVRTCVYHHVCIYIFTCVYICIYI